MINNTKSYKPRKLNNLQLFDRYVEQAYIVSHSRHDAKILLTETQKLKNIETALRDRLTFGSSGDNEDNI